MSDTTEDLGFMARLQAGDRSALEALSDRHTPLMLGVALRILRRRPDAEDAIQDAWIQAWRRRASFDPNRGSVASWLVTIARTRAIDRYRSLVSRGRAESTAEPALPPSDPPPEVSAARADLRGRLAKALASIDPKQRQVIEIAYFEGLSQSEIAERIGVPLGTVKYWTRQGLERLRALVPEDA